MIAGVGAAGQIYVIANIVIALGYLCVPWLVLPYLQLQRRTTIAMAVFFLGCVGSHSDMVFDVIVGHGQHPPVGWIAVWWHLVQAVGTWAAIIFFRAELKRALEVTEHPGTATPQERELAATLVTLRAGDDIEPEDPRLDDAVSKLPGKGEWVKAAPAVFMVCGTLIIMTILFVFMTLQVTGSPTDTFFRLVNLFMNTLGTVATLSALAVGIIHGRRVLDNRRISLAGQAEAHRAADAAAAASKAVNGDMEQRITRAVQAVLAAEQGRGVKQDTRGKLQDVRGREQDHRDPRGAGGRAQGDVDDGPDPGSGTAE